MKAVIRFIIFIFLTVSTVQAQSQPDFTKGVNLTGWFQVNSADLIPFKLYGKQDLINIKSLGCDVIRLPISLHEMSSGAPDYILSPIFFQFMDSVVDWAEQLQLHLILDNHSFDPNINTTVAVESILLKIWPQMAAHYKDRSNYLLYEILNEPHGITTQVWGAIQNNVIQSIRNIDDKHTIIVGGADFNTYSELQNLPFFADTNLIYTFHFYEPFMFTHQGADWFSPSIVSLKGVPFPYDPGSMPPCPPELIGTWVEEALNDYPNEGTIENVKSLINIAIAFKNNRHVKVYCGEFGVYIPNSNPIDRTFWYEEVRQYLEENGIPWTTWDYQDGFGLFNKGSNELFDHDLNVPLLQSLGLTIPPQSPYNFLPDTTGLEIYTDYVENGIRNSSYGDGVINFYSSNLPDNDRYCLDWKQFSQYNSIGFEFEPIKDFSQLTNKGYALDFMIRGNKPDIRFDVRFVDSKTADPADHPWRKSYLIDPTISTWDNKWHHLHIPLTEFEESGSWDNESWFDPEGKFDWSAVDLLEFSTEYPVTDGNELWFDNIILTNLDTAVVRETGALNRPNLTLDNDFNVNVAPNPLNDRSVISLYLPESSQIKVVLYTITGIEVCSLYSGNMSPGLHQLVWDGNDEAGVNQVKGIYILRIISDQLIRSNMLIKE